MLWAWCSHVACENYRPYTSFNFSGINNPIFISPFFASLCSSFKLFTAAREWKGDREIREKDKTKIGSFCYLLACSVLFCFIMFTVWKNQNNFSMMKIPFSLASVFINKTKQTTTKTTSSFSSQWLRLEGGPPKIPMIFAQIKYN